MIDNFKIWMAQSSVNEGMDTEITTDNDDDDEIKVKLPTNNDETKYNKKGDKITKILKTKNGEEETSVDKKTEEYEDVKTLFRAVKDVGDDARKVFVRRISGGDCGIENKDIISRIEDIYDDRMKNGNKDYDCLFPEKGKEKLFKDAVSELKDKAVDCCYIDLSNDVSDNKIKEWFSVSNDRVGKGEYMLPMIYQDVRKNPSQKVGSKGDNSIIGSNEQIEVKASGARFDFVKKDGLLNPRFLPDGPDKISENEMSIKNKSADLFIRLSRWACAGSLAEYMCTRGYNTTLYMCIFNNSKVKQSNKETVKNGKPKKTKIYNVKEDDNRMDGMLVIKSNIANIVSIDNNKTYKALKKLLYEKIVISLDDYANSGDFNIYYNGKSDGKIYCALKYEHAKKCNKDLELLGPGRKKEHKSKFTDMICDEIFPIHSEDITVKAILLRIVKEYDIYLKKNFIDEKDRFTLKISELTKIINKIRGKQIKNLETVLNTPGNEDIKETVQRITNKDEETYTDGSNYTTSFDMGGSYIPSFKNFIEKV